MQPPISGFWAKLERDDAKAVSSWHPLEDHCADVAACTEGLLRSTILNQRLAALCGQETLAEQQIQRLCVLAALHDAGKFATGFQNKAFCIYPQCGHMAELLGLFNDARFSSSIRTAFQIDQILQWADDFDGLFIATISHHGAPVETEVRIDPVCWLPARGLDPFVGLQCLVDCTRSWYPAAWERNGRQLHCPGRFQHGWNGVLTLADWIGSDQERFFPFSESKSDDRITVSRDWARRAMALLGLDPRSARESLGAAPPTFRTIVPDKDKDPWPVQAAIFDVDPGNTGSLAILESETGSGKTEAALAYYVRLLHSGKVDGLYFALPTRTAATQIYERVCKARDSAFGESSKPPVILAVPGYIGVDGKEGKPQADFRVLWDDTEGGGLRFRGWAAERTKRYLASAIAVGTVDQVLVSSLMVRHADMRASALLRSLVVIDEVHASDSYMTRLTEFVLEQHLRGHGYALLMSATLGAAARLRMLRVATGQKSTTSEGIEEACAVAYPLISIVRNGEMSEQVTIPGSTNQKAVDVETMDDMDLHDAVVQRALVAASMNAHVLIIRNTVKACVATQLALETANNHEDDFLFECNGVSAPHHARYAKCDRTLLDRSLEVSFGKERLIEGKVCVATQTVEQSLDLDCDLLITDLCPVDVLLQRIGRLHRHKPTLRPHGFTRARVIVLTPTSELCELIMADGSARGANGLGSVYEDLRVLEATLRLIRDSSTIVIPRDNRRLVEMGTHPQVLEAITRDADERWRKHAQHIFGVVLGEGRLGSLNAIARDVPFGEDGYLFPSVELSRRIQTRLGEGDRLARFAQAQPSPFSRKQEIAEVILPHYLAAGIPADEDTATDLQADDRGFSFSFGPKRFRYDRLGYRAADGVGEES